jgi:cobalt/nickel transport system permease protein
MLFHVGGFHLIENSANHEHSLNLWNDLAAQTKIICTLLAVLAIALTPNGRWWTWLIYCLALLGLAWLSQVSISKLIQRMAIEFSFISTILLGTLFRGGGEVLWTWGWLQITTEGLIILGSVSLKALLSMLSLNILILSTPIPVLLNGLAALRTPNLLIAILASMSRYLNVLVAELGAMRRAAASRNFSSNLWSAKNRAWQRNVLGNTIGMLFIRTYDRGDRIHQAMLSRGYQGTPVIIETPSIGQFDLVALNLTLVIALLGQIIYWKGKY